MKRIKSIILVLIIACSTTMLTACGDKGEIETLINDFETACHSLDFNEILECVDPKIADGVNTALGVVGIFTDISNEEMLDKISSLLIGEKDAEDSSFYETIEIEIKEIDAGKARATADAVISYEINGSAMDKNAKIKCKYSDDEEKWFISNISFK